MTRTSVLRSVRTTGLVFFALFAILFASFTPIVATSSAQAAVSDGSISFNGTNQDITVPDSPAWDIGTGDYTVEWFQYMTSAGSFPRVFSFGGYPSTDLGVSIESGTLYVWSMSGARLYVSMPSDYLNHWKHIAIVRSSGTLSIYINGTRVGTGADSTNINVTRVFHIGSEGSSSTYFPGQISNFHFVNGTALYSGTSLTIPSNPITPVANTKLLLKSVTSGTLLTDSSANAFTLTATNSPTWSNTNPFSSFTTYTVTYNYNAATGGNGTASANFTVGGTALTLPTPTKTGYTFGGWYSDSGLTTSVGSAGAAYSPSASLTLYAKWTANTYTVTYNYNSATGGNGTASASFTVGGSAVTLPTPTRTGYSFGGWYSDSGLTTSVGSAGASYSPSASLTLYAKWIGDIYTVTYNYNSATGGNGTASANYTVGGSALTLPTPTRTDYTFGGWYSDSGLTTSVGSAGASYSPSASLTLYAKWTVNTYTVTYNYNSATGGNSTTSAAFTAGGAAITLPTPTRTGYTFGGWYSDSGLTTSVGLAGASYSPSASLTLYAKWIGDIYTVTYNYNSATGGNSTSSVNYTVGGSAVTLPTPTRTGYTFGGWYSDAGLTSSAGSAGAAYSPSADVALYAKWTANSLAVTYQTNGGTTIAAGSTTVGSSIASAPTAPTKTGYDFAGWYSDSGLTSAVSFPYAHGQLADFTLYAKWTAATYTVTYNYNSATGGNSATSASYTYLGTAVTLPTPTRTGYTFAGWYSDSGLTISAGSAGASFTTTASVTLYAKWLGNSYTVTYNYNSATGGNSATSANYTVGVSAVTLPTPTRTGYTFAGWYSDAGLTSSAGSAGASYSPSADATLYAKWVANNLAVTYQTNGGTTIANGSTTVAGSISSAPTPPTKTGYDFAGWYSDSGLTTAASFPYAHGQLADFTLYAKWTAATYTVTYNYNSATGGNSTTSANYTTGGSSITLPTPTRTGYSFIGWYAESGLTTLLGTGGASFTTSSGATLYAKWTANTYTVTYNYNGATGGNSTSSANYTTGGSAVTLPTPTRTNFVFDGWFDSLSGGNLIGAAADSFTTASAATVYAHWTQASLSGIAAGDLVSVGSLVASDSIGVEFGASTNGSSVHVSVPAGSLPSGTTITMNLLNNFTHAQNAITGAHDFVLSLVVSWLTTDGFVPTTNAGKPIAMTITNSAIKRGDAIYVLVHGVATMVGRATTDGQAVVEITDDPEIVIASTRPLGVTNVTATDGDDGSSTVSWTAPSIDGGSVITGYTVTSSGGHTCTVTSTSCTITGLTNGTSYTFSVVATNAIGNSTSITSSSITPAAVVNTIQNVTPPVTTPVTPPVTTPITPPVTTPVTPPVTEPVKPPVTEPVTPPITTPVTPTVPLVVTPAKPVTFASSSIGLQLKPAQVLALKAMKAKKGFTVKVTTKAMLGPAAKKAMQSIANRVTGAINAAFTKFKAKSLIQGQSKTSCKSPSGVCVVIAPTK